MHLDVPLPAQGVRSASGAAAAARHTTKKSENESAKKGNAARAHSDMITGIGAIGLPCTLALASFFRSVRTKTWSNG